MTVPTAPVAPTTATRRRRRSRAHTNSPNGRSARIVPSPDSSNAACSARTAPGTAAPAMTQEILIGDVEIISMFTPSAPSVVKTFAATPGWDFIPAPMTDTLPIDSSVWISRPSSSASGASATRASAQVGARHGERHVRDGALGDGLVLDDHVDVHVRDGERGRDPAGDAGRVGHALDRDPGLLGRMRDGGDERLFHGLLFSDHHGTRLIGEARSAVDPNPVVAGVLDGAQLQDAGAGGRHLEHLLERHDGQLAGVGDDPRVGAEDARDVGVDLADLGADRRRERDRGGVRAAAAERRDVLRGRHALEAGDEHDRVLVETLTDPIGAHV